ncbi:MAG: 50S ribosomal protein L32 [Parcubacteria group bacterium]|nr:50S ribosomal protein L32 [Parcubacteria group bacterium]
MGVPTQRHTKSRRNKGRSHMALKQPVFSYCAKCHVKKMPHQICENCGYYGGKEVIDVLAKLEKKERKKKKKDLAVQEQKAGK